MVEARKIVSIFTGEPRFAAQQAPSESATHVSVAEANASNTPDIFCAQVGAVAVTGEPILVQDILHTDVQHTIRLFPRQADWLKDFMSNGVEPHPTITALDAVRGTARIINGGNLTLISPMLNDRTPIYRANAQSGAPYGFFKENDLVALGISTESGRDFLMVTSAAGTMNIVSATSLGEAAGITHLTPITFCNDPAWS